MDKKEKHPHIKDDPEKDEDLDERDPLDDEGTEEEKEPKEEIMDQMEEDDKESKSHEDAEVEEEAQPEEKSEETEEEEPGNKPITTEELLHNSLPKAEDDEETSTNAQVSGSQGEHTLDDLAAEGEHLPAGVEPSRPKSFLMDDDESPRNLNSHLPSSGVYGRREPKNRRGRSLFLLIIALLVIGGVVYLLKGRLGAFEGGAPQPSPSESVAEEPSEAPTPTPSVDRSKYTVDVLNGSGKKGLAASVSAKLQGLGYQQGKAANATNSAFTRTVVLSKDSAKEAVDTLVKDLAPDFDATAEGVLQDSATADLEVILGAK